MIIFMGALRRVFFVKTDKTLVFNPQRLSLLTACFSFFAWYAGCKYRTYDLVKEGQMGEAEIKGRRGRRRAAQQPAAEPGFYARGFTADEAADLSRALPDGLNSEIDLLRVVIRRVFEQASDQAATLKDWTGALAALANASARLAMLIKTQAGLGSATNQVLAALSKAVGEVLEEQRR
jgi:hypothetical protein